MIEIPLTSDGERKFSMVLDSVSYDFRTLYNTRVNLWAMDISSVGEELVNGIALVIGGDIMSPYNVGLKNLFVINTTESDLDANADNLGTDVRLFQLTDEEVSDVASV